MAVFGTCMTMEFADGSGGSSNGAGPCSFTGTGSAWDGGVTGKGQSNGNNQSPTNQPGTATVMSQQWRDNLQNFISTRVPGRLHGTQYRRAMAGTLVEIGGIVQVSRASITGLPNADLVVKPRNTNLPGVNPPSWSPRTNKDFATVVKNVRAIEQTLVSSGSPPDQNNPAKLVRGASQATLAPVVVISALVGAIIGALISWGSRKISELSKGKIPANKVGPLKDYLSNPHGMSATNKRKLAEVTVNNLRSLGAVVPQSVYDEIKRDPNNSWRELMEIWNGWAFRPGAVILGVTAGKITAKRGEGKTAFGVGGIIDQQGRSIAKVKSYTEQASRSLTLQQKRDLVNFAFGVRDWQGKLTNLPVTKATILGPFFQLAGWLLTRAGQFMLAAAERGWIPPALELIGAMALAPEVKKELDAMIATMDSRPYGRAFTDCFMRYNPDLAREHNRDVARGDAWSLANAHERLSIVSRAINLIRTSELFAERTLKAGIERVRGGDLSVRTIGGMKTALWAVEIRNLQLEYTIEWMTGHRDWAGLDARTRAILERYGITPN